MHTYQRHSTAVRTYTAKLWEKNIFFFLKKHFYNLIGMADTFFALRCDCVSISFIILLFHDYDGATGLFFHKTLHLTDNTRA